MQHVSHIGLAKAESPCRFPYLLIHLFWGGDEQNQWTFYLHYLILRHEIELRPQRGSPGLTTKEWRSILGNTYWKSMWPKPDDKDPSLPSKFDPAMFWIHGGPLLFGDDLSAQVAAGADPTSVLPYRCDVQMDTADNIKVQQMVLYHLNMDHAVVEIRAMDCLQFPSDYEKR
jgi:hypothetical protein